MSEDNYVPPPSDDTVLPERAPAAPVSRPHDSREVTSDVDAQRRATADADSGGAAALLAVARTQPFMRNFNRCAHDRFPARMTAETRVSKMIEEHPHWYKACFVADYILVLMAILLIGTSAALVIWKTFFA